MIEGRKIRLSQRQEWGGQVRRGCNLEVTPEAEGQEAVGSPASSHFYRGRERPGWAGVYTVPRNLEPG